MKIFTQIEIYLNNLENRNMKIERGEYFCKNSLNKGGSTLEQEQLMADFLWAFNKVLDKYPEIRKKAREIKLLRNNKY